MKYIGLITVILLGILLVIIGTDYPDWGDPSSPASRHVSPYYLEHSLDDTAVPNVVTSVLADYRSYDTMFETAVIFSAGLACFFLLRVVKRTEPKSYIYRHVPTGLTIRIERDAKQPEASEVFSRIDSQWIPEDLIIKTTCRFVIPFIQLFALYVVAHGHHSPGGGFQGGVILGATFILFALTRNLHATLNRFREKAAALLSVVGLFLYAGTGALCIIFGAWFLDYSALAPLLGTDRVMARSHGILSVEIGVALAVMAVMIWIFYNLSSAGKQDEGL